MSLYSSKIKSDLIDPIVDIQNNRVEFKLPQGTGYYPTLRLANFGSVGGGVAYNRGAGAYGLIRRIRLLNGAEELSSLDDAGRYMTFKFYNNSNADNQSLFQPLYEHLQGYALNDTLKVQDTQRADFFQAEAGDSDQVKAQKSITVNLMELLPMLQNVPVLDTNVFKDLRLQIEYSTDGSEVLNDSTDAFATNAPVLIADEIQDPKLVQMLSAQMKAVVWNEIEHDIVNIADNDNPADTEKVQSVKIAISGYDNKYVSRLLMTKAFQNSAKDKANANENRNFGPFNSYAQHKEKVNFALNGKNIFVGDGLDTPAKKLMVLNDAFGECNLPSFGHVECVGADKPIDNSANVIGVPNLRANKQGDAVGAMDFIGLHLESRVNQLELVYERATPQNADAQKPVDQLAEALNVHLFAEVRKQLVVQNGKYMIAYV
jgi:hypothetical protein